MPPGPSTRTTLTALVLTGAFAVVACTPMMEQDSGPPAHSGRMITEQEIANSGAQTAWEAVRLLSGYVRFTDDENGRPSSMTARGKSSIYLSSAPSLFMDGVRIVDFTVLHELSARNLESIQLITGPDATTYFGTNSGNGVIYIRTKAPGNDAEPSNHIGPR